jgi:hypothetical protein
MVSQLNKLRQFGIELCQDAAVSSESVGGRRECALKATSVGTDTRKHSREVQAEHAPLGRAITKRPLDVFSCPVLRIAEDKGGLFCLCPYDAKEVAVDKSRPVGYVVP